jgi:thioredoxin 1
MGNDSTSPVRELTDADFRSAIQGASLAFVDVYASWCGSCRLFYPTFEGIAAKHPKASFFKIDGDVNPECRSDLTISNLPYVAAYRGGKFVEGISTTTEEGFEEFVARLEKQGS